jgi:hypothetical protein
MRYLLLVFTRKKSGQIDETVTVRKQVQVSDMNQSNVILDFAEKKIVKCIIEGKQHDTTFEIMREYYSKIYPKLIDQLEKEAPITAAQEKAMSKQRTSASKK